MQMSSSRVQSDDGLPPPVDIADPPIEACSNVAVRRFSHASSLTCIQYRWSAQLR